MFTVIYSFQVKDGKQAQFEQSWLNLTKLIYEYEGSLGSRLHKKDELNYVAYAQWPSKEIWEESGNSLPNSSKLIRQNMRESCQKITTEHELQVITDYLKDKTYI